MSVLALVLFILTYCLMIALPKYRPWVALTSAALYVALGFVPLRALAGAVDWNVLLMLALAPMGVMFPPRVAPVSRPKYSRRGEQPMVPAMPVTTGSMVAT